MKRSSFAGGCVRQVETASNIVSVKQEVNENSRNGYVQPDGISPFGHLLMGKEFSRGCEEEGACDERHHHHGKDDVGDEYEEIDGAYPSLSREFGVTLEVVIDEVADEKGGGGHGGRYHHGRVLFL